MRQFLSVVVPLLLPTGLYFLYVLGFRRSAPADAAQTPSTEVPWVWLGIAGAVLVALTFLLLAHFGGSPPGSTYVPAKVIDGTVQPGHFE